MIYDVLIIGGGPAGATTALLLAEAGWSVAIVEKKSFPRRKVCGEFISATSLPLLHQLGIADFYLKNSGPEIKRVGLFAADSVLASSMPRANDSIGHFGRALVREALDSQLLCMAGQKGAKIWQPFEVKSLERNKDHFTAIITQDQQSHPIMAHRVIMANGSWEKEIVSHHQYTHKPSDLLAFKSHFKQCQFDVDLMPLLVFPGGYGGLVHSDTEKVTLSCCIRRDYLQAARLRYPGMKAGDAVLQHIKASTRGVRDAFLNAEQEGGWLSAGPIRPGIRNRYMDGIFFVGNSAGEAHPVVAEGISMAMQSGWLLSQVLISSGHHVDAAGRDYTKRWNTHFASRIHVAIVFAHLAMHPWSVAAILPVLKRFPSLLTVGARLSGKAKQVVPAMVSKELTATETGNTM